RFEADLEIPSRLAFADMKDKLLEILKILDGHEFREWSACSLRHRGRILADGETLADVGAFDGARLAAERKR
ncbi:MAG: EsaB/YukD family protein, partial [Synergistaceae bacterium]|nr:EsaB/YukD family protein [Synergistaceae bacterium]